MTSQRITCLKCNGHNFVVTAEKGMKHCFNCGYHVFDRSMSYVPLVRSKNIAQIRLFYTEIARYYHSNLQTEHRQYLNKRGITDQTIQELQIGYCPDGKHPYYKGMIAKEAGLALSDQTCSLKERITFPFISEDEGVTDLWGRDLSENGSYKYKSPYTYNNIQRGSDYPYLVDSMIGAKRIIITEGIIKPILPYQYGLSCVGMPGTLAYRPIHPTADQEVIICFDNQVNHRSELITAITKISNQFYMPKIATLPLRDKKKQDIDSYILSYGIEEFNRVIDGALDYKVWRGLVI